MKHVAMLVRVPAHAARRGIRAMRAYPLRTLIAAVIALAALYWGLFASDRYVCEARIVVRRTDSGTRTPGDLLALLPQSGDARDALLLRERLLSLDMMRTLDRALALRAHYGDTRRDPISRLPERHATDEVFADYLRKRIRVTYDDYAHVLLVSVAAYTPEMAQAIASRMIEEGERYINRIGNELAGEQVRFITGQVVTLGERRHAARRQLLAFQDTHGLASPASTLETASALIGQLEAERAQLSAQRDAMAIYLTPQAAEMVRLDARIAALRKQIGNERDRLAAPRGGRLNSLVEQQQRLQTDAEIADQLYAGARTALEVARVESVRKIARVEVIQSPALPQSPTEPLRLRNLAVFAAALLLAAGALHLLASIVRDHRD